MDCIVSVNKDIVISDVENRIQDDRQNVSDAAGNDDHVTPGDQGNINRNRNNERVNVRNVNDYSVSDNKSLNFAHVNIVTLPGKIDEIRYLLENHPIDVPGFAETRLGEKISDNFVDIANTTIYRHDSYKHGGGVAAYVNNNAGIITKVRNDLMSDDSELFTLEIKYTKCKPIIVMFSPLFLKHCGIGHLKN